MVKPTIDSKTLRVKKGQYLESEFPKTNIFLHHTAGTTASGAVSWWNQTPDRVGTAYVIDRDGTIYEVFEPTKWAYHLGIRGDNDHLEKVSINIELVSAGRLYQRPDGKYFFYPLYPKISPSTLIPPGEVTILKTPFKGHSLYHSYTDAQIKSVCELIPYLMYEYCIPLQSDYKKFMDFNPDIWLKEKVGIYSHTAVRRDKDDIFPQPNFIKALMDLFKSLSKK